MLKAMPSKDTFGESRLQGLALSDEVRCSWPKRTLSVRGMVGHALGIFPRVRIIHGHSVPQAHGAPTLSKTFLLKKSCRKSSLKILVEESLVEESLVEDFLPGRSLRRRGHCRGCLHPGCLHCHKSHRSPRPLPGGHSVCPLHLVLHVVLYVTCLDCRASFA